MEQQQIDVNTIDDIKELKSIAYDLNIQLLSLQQQLQVVQNRILQLVQQADAR